MLQLCCRGEEELLVNKLASRIVVLRIKALRHKPTEV